MPRINKLYLSLLLCDESRIVYKKPSTSYLVAFTFIKNILKQYLNEYRIMLIWVVLHFSIPEPVHATQNV